MKRKPFYTALLFAVVSLSAVCTNLSAQENLIPEGTTHIKDYAFEKNEDLTSIEIPEGVVSIGEGAFLSCKNLHSVTIPNSVISIGKYAFDQCTSLQSISLENCKLDSIQDLTFYDCESLTSITLPASITYIGEQAFMCSGLSTIDLPESLKKIDRMAFNESYLASVTIPKNVIFIGSCAFEHCMNLRSVSITGTPKTDGNVFAGCENLESVSMENAPLDSIQKWDFIACKNLTTVIFPANLVYIGESAFSGSRKLSSINLPESLEKIDGYAFSHCNLKELVLPDNLKVIERGVFEKNPELSKISIGSNLEKIGWLAFFLCPEISEFQVSPNNPHFCSENGILYSKNKNTLVIYPPKHSLPLFKLPDETRVIGQDAFQDNYTLNTLDINQATSFEGDENFFWKCTSLVELRTADDNTVFQAVDGVLYSKNKDQLVVYPMEKIPQYTPFPAHASGTVPCKEKKHSRCRKVSTWFV